ncbi:MAG: Txe/YoeB family addiction module toxin [Chloroflexi bacterium]|nr:Txe/YoeB family addiction module toxin [Chloroflexota bacterium]
MTARQRKERDGSQRSSDAAAVPVRERRVIISKQFREDLTYWVENDRGIALRCLELIDQIARDPFHGIGKPERLKYEPPNTWSRRLTDEHRIVYVVEGDRVELLTARYHYE